jgi:hypothetical protein
MQLLYRFALLVLMFAAHGSVSAQQPLPELTVLKSPTCGCCVKWMDHLHEHGFATSVDEPDNLAERKTKLGIAPQYRSCHTGISAQGYVFEGHVPSKFIHGFLASPPEDAIGLSVPGMPVGSPGMEMGERFMQYQVLVLNEDGSSEVYAEVNTPGDQYAQ